LVVLVLEAAVGADLMFGTGRHQHGPPGWRAPMRRASLHVLLA
jgi:hypothetical protein